jgi:hypothetical protein
MGGPGTGKTPFAAELVKTARRVVFFDPTGDLASHGEQTTADELEQPDALAGQVLRLVVIADPDHPAPDFVRTLAACRAAAPHGGLVLVVDEVGDLTRECTDELNSLHRNGHHDGVASVLISPCATDFPKRCRDTATRVYSFFQKSARDEATLDEEYGHNFGARARAWRHPAPPVEWVNPVLHAKDAPRVGALERP